VQHGDKRQDASKKSSGDNSINGSKDMVLESIIAEFMGSKSLHKMLNEKI